MSLHILSLAMCRFSILIIKYINTVKNYVNTEEKKKKMESSKGLTKYTMHFTIITKRYKNAGKKN